MRCSVICLQQVKFKVSSDRHHHFQWRIMLSVLCWSGCTLTCGTLVNHRNVQIVRLEKHLTLKQENEQWVFHVLNLTFSSLKSYPYIFYWLISYNEQGVVYQVSMRIFISLGRNACCTRSRITTIFPLTLNDCIHDSDEIIYDCNSGNSFFCNVCSTFCYNVRTVQIALIVVARFSESQSLTDCSYSHAQVCVQYYLPVVSSLTVFFS